VHNLTATPALGATDQTIGTVTISENTGVALASVAARKGQNEACEKILKSILGAVPGVGKTILHDPEAGFWMADDRRTDGNP